MLAVILSVLLKGNWCLIIVISNTPAVSVVQIGYRVKTVVAVDAPTLGVASSDANNRGMVTGVGGLVACVVAKVLITKEICSVVKLLDLPLCHTLAIIE